MTAYIDTFAIPFYISFVGMLGMLGFKALELRSGKQIWVLRLLNVVNHKVHDWYLAVKKFISYFNRRSAVAFVEWIAYHILSWARSAYIWAHKKAHAHPPSKKVIDMVRGRGDVSRSAGASLYLKRISEPEEPVKVK